MIEWQWPPFIYSMEQVMCGPYSHTSESLSSVRSSLESVATLIRLNPNALTVSKIVVTATNVCELFITAL